MIDRLDELVGDGEAEDDDPPKDNQDQELDEAREVEVYEGGYAKEHQRHPGLTWHQSRHVAHGDLVDIRRRLRGLTHRGASPGA